MGAPYLNYSILGTKNPILIIEARVLVRRRRTPKQAISSDVGFEISARSWTSRDSPAEKPSRDHASGFRIRLESRNEGFGSKVRELRFRGN